MKKNMILPLLLAGTAMLLVSCMKEELEPAAPSSVSGKTLVFEGRRGRDPYTYLDRR